MRDDRNYKVYVPAAIARAWVEQGVRDLNVVFNAEKNSLVITPIADHEKKHAIGMTELIDEEDKV